MRISDWSSDVCSSDLPADGEPFVEREREFGARRDGSPVCGQRQVERIADAHLMRETSVEIKLTGVGARNGVENQTCKDDPDPPQIGRASCRERVCQYE